MQQQHQIRKLCNQPKPLAQVVHGEISATRLNFLLSTNKKWVNGTVIKYMFIEAPEGQLAIVRKAFQQWKDPGIGLSFEEVNNRDESMVRIGFDLTDGSWSYVGRDILTIPKSDRTMNFGWDLAADDYGLTTALHEIGHTIGFQHEHQSPFAGIEWNTDAVYREFSGPPNNWARAEIDSNIISKVPPNQVTGSNWDPASIMEYQFGPGLVADPPEFRVGIFPPGTLSPEDISGVKAFYPPLNTTAAITLKPGESLGLNNKPGQQADFVFTAPATKKYTFQTFGKMDTVMVVSEKTKNELHYLSGDDDSGTEKNSMITLPLVQGRDYLVNLRTLYAHDKNSGGIVVY